LGACARRGGTKQESDGNDYEFAGHCVAPWADVGSFYRMNELWSVFLRHFDLTPDLHLHMISSEKTFQTLHQSMLLKRQASEALE